MMKSPRYWIGVVSLSHVEKGVEGGFAQLCHGKCAPLQKMSVGDWLIYYSPKTEMSEGEPLQKFTAIGQVVGESAYKFEMTSDFVPYRRNISYRKCAAASILPIKEQLSFIKDPKHWGYPFRNGQIEITEQDFKLIASAMQVGIDEKV